MHTNKRTNLRVSDLKRSIVYKPLAVMMAILMLPVVPKVSWAASGTCTGSANAGFPCASDADCPGGSCPTDTDTSAPTEPSSLTVTEITLSLGGQAHFLGLKLNWVASDDPDSPDITYHVERDIVVGVSDPGFTEVTTTTSTSYEDTDTFLAGTTGSSPIATALYRVRAADAAGNYSSYSIAIFPHPSSGGISNPIFQSLPPCSGLSCSFSSGQNSATTSDLMQLESDAVNAYLAGHNLPATDAHVV